MQRDWLMGWAPLAHIFADGLPARPALRSPDPLRFTDAEQAKRRALDVPLNQAVAPAVAPSVRPVAEPASTLHAPIGTPNGVYDDPASGDRFYIHNDAHHNVMRGAREVLRDFGRCAAPPWLPAQREQVADTVVRQPDSKGESKPTTASDGEWKTQPPTEPGWYIAECSPERESRGILARHWDGAGWSDCIVTLLPNPQLSESVRHGPHDRVARGVIQWLRGAAVAEIGE